MTKLEDCALEVVGDEVGMKYVKDGEAGWTPVVRRRRIKCAGDEDGDKWEFEH